MIIPGMVWLLIWKYFFDPTFGILNKILNVTGMMWVLHQIDKILEQGIFIEGVDPTWLGQSKLIVPSVIIWDFPWVMQRIAEKLGFQTETLGEVRQRNDSQSPNSCFDYYFGRNSLKMKLESLSF